METKLIKIDRNNIDTTAIQAAGDVIKSGGLVAFPTETVYGLGADGLNPKAAMKTYAAKGRPSDNPLIIHIAHMDDLPRITKSIPATAKKLAKEFWPGPLTMILEKSELVPLETTGGLETLAVRMPQDPLALVLIEAAGGYVSAPSANASGRPSPTEAKHVMEDLTGRIDMVIDGGNATIGLESTIIDLTVSPPIILRPGSITVDMITSVIGPVDMNLHGISGDSEEAPKAPGMKYRHYAPQGVLTIVEGTLRDEVQAIRQIAYARTREGVSCGIIASEETYPFYTNGIIKNIGSRENIKTIARNLYRVLREFDEEGVEYIYSESFAIQGLGDAIMNRLNKAAGQVRISAKYILQMQQFRRVVFLGGTDVCRSPMAAELLRNQDLVQHVVIQSKGLVALFPEPVNPKTETIMKNHGYSIIDHTPKAIKVEDFHMDTLVLTIDEVTKKRLLSSFPVAVKYPVYTMQEYTGINKDIPNPIGKNLEVYGLCYDIIEEMVKVIAEQLNQNCKPATSYTESSNVL